MGQINSDECSGKGGKRKIMEWTDNQCCGAGAARIYVILVLPEWHNYDAILKHCGKYCSIKITSVYIGPASRLTFLTVRKKRIMFEQNLRKCNLDIGMEKKVN
jgi:hypothetical protein